MADTIKTLVALDEGVDAEVVRAALPEGIPAIQIVGLVHGLDESWRTLQETTTDLLVIACSGYSERALFLIEPPGSSGPSGRSSSSATARRTASSAGSSRPAPTTSSGCRRRRIRSASRSRRPSRRKQGTALATGIAVAPMICVLGPKGGSGQDRDGAQPRGRARDGGRLGRCWSTSTFSSATSGSRSALAPDKTIYDLAKSGGSLDAEKLEAYLGRTSRGRACSSLRPGRIRRPWSPSSSCATSTRRSGAPSTTWSSTRLRASRPR